tara:strand:+ start:1688 stop:1972 length:285 start_codon:yes stop_codon:yes gene_type:complete
VLSKLLIGALVAAAMFGGVQTTSLAWEKELRVAAEVRNASLTLLLEGCRARADNLIEDKESDDAVDTLTDDELRVVPSHWLRDARASDRDPAAD